MSTLFSAIDVQELLPQRRPYVFVDALLDYQEGKALSAYTITPETYFVMNECVMNECVKNECVKNEGVKNEGAKAYLPVSGLVENMAQTCALKIGYYHKYILHEPVRIGYLAGVKTLHLHQLPVVGQTIYTQIEVLHEVRPMSLVSVKVELKDHTLIADATIQIVETDQDVIPLA